MDWPAAIAGEAELEEVMFRPEEATRADLAAVAGDLPVLGAGGQVGPALCRMAKRADLAATGTVAAITIAPYQPPCDARRAARRAGGGGDGARRAVHRQ